MALTEKQIQALRPRDGVDRYRVCDGRGLYLVVFRSGRKTWSARISRGGKLRWVSLGEYPEMSLKEAREKRYTMDLDRGDCARFAEIAETWYADRHVPVVGETTARATRSHLDRFILPAIGRIKIGEIEPQDIFRICRAVQEGSPTGGRLCRSIISRIFRYAVSYGAARWDPASYVGAALLPPAPHVHYSVVQTKEQASLVLRSIKEYDRNEIVRLGLLLLAHTFVRPGEMRLARWSELDLDGGEWHIPPERMKAKRAHVVPLCPQAVSLFRALRDIVPHPDFCFYQAHYGKVLSRPRFAATMRDIGDRAGWQMSPHGFRGMASTLLNEHGFRPDVIERQLAHEQKDKVRNAYNRAEYLEERRAMMCWWGDFLEGL